mmetsp:Transcript_18813/g.46613  ORF Transcript_18813/g.46613 Transcript_18813/m.46613 type:complete len:298 (+) Transcript_18813:733-1626(+)
MDRVLLTRMVQVSDPECGRCVSFRKSCSSPFLLTPLPFLLLANPFFLIWFNLIISTKSKYQNSTMSNTNQLILSLLLLLVLSHVNGFSIGPSSQRVPASSTTTTVLQEGKDENTDPDMNPLTKSAWYATELFGKVFGNKDKVQSENDAPPEELDFSQPPQSLKETLARIKLDNDRSYFLSGQVDEEIYDPKCVFSDPFVAFEGRERFVTNLANLGSFITNYSARVLNYDEQDPTVVQTKIMVKLELNLPWKPILAWPWGVQYTIDPETNLIVDHKESWDIEALEGVKQIFRKPTLTI